MILVKQNLAVNAFISLMTIWIQHQVHEIKKSNEMYCAADSINFNPYYSEIIFFNVLI